MSTYEPRNLKRWSLPDSYFGAHWPDYYRSGFGQSRDSDLLEESNFAMALKALDDESETVIVVRESHWAVGWVEWIAIHESDSKALAIADDLNDRMTDYPCLSEDDWSRREYEQVCNVWEQFSLSDRIEALKRFDLSIFAARRAELPTDDDGSLFQYLTA